MDIQISDSWLREFLKTQATPVKIAECLSLCGPSVEKVEKKEGDCIYHIEITTNRVDAAGVYGIAREAAAILPRFGIFAELVNPKVKSGQQLVKKVDYLRAVVDYKLCSRFSAILIKDVDVHESPKWMQKRIRSVGLRPINNIVDISNYLMHELGQPTHTFDYDKINGRKMLLRESRRGEKVTTLDGKTHTLAGGDIVIEDGGGKLIDLAGVMGGANSAVDEATRNVLFFVQTYSPANIRRTSMTTGARSEAASLFEKGLDTELVELTLRRGVDLLTKLAGGQPVGQILDLYPRPYKGKDIGVDLDFIAARLGVDITKGEVVAILKSLGFKVVWKGSKALIAIPSYRAGDIDIQEDIVEEVARIYGYHNLPSKLMSGLIPFPIENSPFDFEKEVKEILKGWGGTEIYTSSLTSRENATLAGDVSWLLRLKNAIGENSEYLRDCLAPSLVRAVQENAREKDPYYFFELSNVYLPIRGQLPEERMMIAGIFSGYEFAGAKGVVEALLQELRVEAFWLPEDSKGFSKHKHLWIKRGTDTLGRFGELEKGGYLHGSGYLYFELDSELVRAARKRLSFSPLPKYPAQIEDMTLVLPSRTMIGELIDAIRGVSSQIVEVELLKTYKNTASFRIAYQNSKKTLDDRDVEKIREKILKVLRKKFRVRVK